MKYAEIKFEIDDPHAILPEIVAILEKHGARIVSAASNDEKTIRRYQPLTDKILI